MCWQVEDASALHEFDSILTSADGIVLSRGNLGLDVAPEKMARVQKSVVSACNLLGTCRHKSLPYLGRLLSLRSACPTAPLPCRPLWCACGRLVWNH